MRSIMQRAALSCGAAFVLSIAAPVAAHAACDPIDPAACLLPFPNDYFTKADRNTDTGRRLNLGLLEMPRNIAGKPIDPTDYNRNDGFSPGTLIVTRVPGLDTEAAFTRSGIVPITDPARSFDPAQPVVLIDARTGARQLDLGRARVPGLHRQGTRRRNARHPPCAQPRRGGAATSSPCATCAAPTAASSPHRRASRRSATASRRSTRRWRSDAPTSTASSPPCTPRQASPAATCTSPGTSRSPASATSPSACSTSATTPSRNSAIATSPT